MPGSFWYLMSRNKVLLLSKSACEKSMCSNCNHSFSLCAVLSVSAASSPLCHSQHSSFSLLASPSTSSGHSQMLLWKLLLPAPVLPFPAPSLCQLTPEGLDVPIHIMVITVCQYKKGNNCSCLKWGKIWVRPSLTLQRLLWILLKGCELLSPGKMYSVPKWLAATPWHCLTKVSLRPK